MKRTLLILACIAAFSFAKAEGFSLNSPAPTPPHLEFKYYGFYGVVEYTGMWYGEHEKASYMDPSGTMHYYVDQYMLNGFSAVAGFQLRKESGFGIGVSYLSDPEKSFSQIPVYLEFRSHYTRSRVAPFTTLLVGWSFPAGSRNYGVEYTKINEGGMTAGVSAGIRIAFTQKLGMNLYCGYQLIQFNSVERGFNQVASTKLPELYHNLKFGVGINF